MNSQKQYVLVAAGAVHAPDHNGLSLPKILPGSVVVVQPSSQAYWRGAPVPRIVASPTPDSAGTLLGVLKRPPVPAGANFGEPLAVLTIIVQGDAELLEEQHAVLREQLGPEMRWMNYCGRRVLLLSQNRMVLR